MASIFPMKKGFVVVSSVSKPRLSVAARAIKIVRPPTPAPPPEKPQRDEDSPAPQDSPPSLEEAMQIRMKSEMPKPKSEDFDVSRSVVESVYRSTPWKAEEKEDTSRTKARILFVGECNVCRSLLALSIMKRMILEKGLEDLVECDSKATKEYNVGQGPETSTIEAAKDLGITLPLDTVAIQIVPEFDVVSFDLLLAMDKFTCADVMREVASFDLINKDGNYSSKVRLLGDFHPVMCKSTAPGAQDIDDPLYGNVGGDEEKESVIQAAQVIEESCQGLMQWLIELKSQRDEEGDQSSFPLLLRKKVCSMKRTEWMVPPMLSPRRR